MALNAETRIRKTTDTLMNMFHNAYDRYIQHLIKERDAALHQLSEAKVETEHAKEEARRIREENESMKEEMWRWKREAEESRRQLASTRVRMSLTIVPLGDPGLHNDGPLSYCSLDQILSDDSPSRQRRMVEVRPIALEQSMPTSEFDQIMKEEVKSPQITRELSPWPSTPSRKPTPQKVENIASPP